MNNKDRSRIKKHAEQLHFLWKSEHDSAEGDPWKNLPQRQAFHDALVSLKVCGLITEFDLEKIIFPEK